MRTVSRWLLVACAATLLASAPCSNAQGRRGSISASCPSGCDPAPSIFQVPSGYVARGFAIQSLVAGKACSGTQEQLRGFSIRRGGQTVLVFYFGPSGPVSDPLPVEDLELAAGTYELYAAPASGASVTLSFQVVSP